MLVYQRVADRLIWRFLSLSSAFSLVVDVMVNVNSQGVFLVQMSH